MNKKLMLKITSLVLTFVIVLSALTVPVSATENTEKFDVVGNALTLIDDVKSAIERNLSDNPSAAIVGDSTLPNIPLNNKYQISNAGFWSYDDILINKEYGTMSYSKELFSLDGINNLDVLLGIRFDSDSAIYNSDASNEENENYNFYNSRYSLGVGWSLSLPTIEIVNNDKYLHTASGEKFKISSTNALEGYLLKNLAFSSAAENEFTSNSVDAVYKTTDADNNKDYFDADGKYLGTKDYLGNKIKITYNSDGLIDKIIEPAGRYISFTYNTTETGRQIVLKLYDKGTNPSSATVYTLNQKYNETNRYYYLTSITDAINRTISFDYSEYNNNITVDEQTILEKSIDLCGIENYNSAYTGIEYQTKQTPYGTTGIKNYKVVSKCFRKDTKTATKVKLSTAYNYSFDNAVSWRTPSENETTIPTITVTSYENTYESSQTEVLKNETTIDSYSRILKERQYLCNDANEQTDENIIEYSNFTIYNQPTVVLNKTMGTDGSYLFTKNTYSYDKYGNVLDSLTVSGSNNGTTTEEYSTTDSKSSNSYDYSLSKTIPISSVEFTKAETDAVFATATINTISTKTGKIESAVTETFDMTNVNKLSELVNVEPIKQLTKTEYTYSTLGNLIKEVETDLTYKGIQTTSYAYDSKYNAYVTKTSQSGIKNADGEASFNVNGSSDIVTKSDYDMFGNEIATYDTYGNKTFKYYDAAGNLIRTGEYSTPYQTIFDWEDEDVGEFHPYISGLNSDTSKWSANFDICSDTNFLCSGSNKGIKITNIVTYETYCRVALTVSEEMMENSLGMRFFAAPSKANGGIKVTFKDYDSVYYDVYSTANTNGSWIDIGWDARMYKNGPDVWEWTTGSIGELRKTKTIWITFQNMQPGEIAYLDDIQILKNQAGTEIETISETDIDYQNNITVTSNKDGTGSKTITDNFGNVLESYEKLPNGNYKLVSECEYNNSFLKTVDKSYVTPELYTVTNYTYNAKGEMTKSVVKDQDGKTLSSTEYDNNVQISDGKVYDISYEKVTASAEGETRTTATNSFTDASGNEVKSEKIAEFSDDYTANDSETTNEYNIYGNFGELLETSGDEIETEQYIQDSTGETVITAYGEEETTYEATVTDGFGQTISETDANTNANLDEELDPDNLDETSGVITKYDAAGRVVETKTPFEKDANGNIVYSIVKTDYDANGNVIRERTRKDKNVYYEKINTYDADNNLVMVQQRNGDKSQYTQYLYDDNNRVIRIYSGLSKSLTIVSENNIRTNGDEDYSVIAYAYDFYGNKTSYTDQYGNTETYKYNEYSGFLEEVIKRDGTKVSYTYDVNGNLLSQISESSTQTVKKAYTYNSENMVKSAVTSIKSADETEYTEQYKTVYYYDMNGNVYNERTTNNETGNIINKAYEYDTKGNVTKTTVSKVIDNELSTLYNYGYTYYDDGNVETETVSVTGSDTIAKISYTYDANGNILTKTASEETTESSTTKLISTFSYNLSDLCVSESHDTGSVYKYNYLYTYTPDGNMTKSSVSWYQSRTDTIYTYDNLNRLTSEEQQEYNKGGFASQFKDEYSFDDFNNITSKTHIEENNNYTQTSTYNKTRLVSQAKSGSINSQITYTYDDNGNMATKSSVTGEITTETEFSYDAFDRTTSISIGDIETSFAYNTDNDRVIKSTGTKVTESILDNGSISADLIGDTVKVYTDDNSVYCENGVFTYNIINSKGDLVALVGSNGVDYKYNAYGEKLTSNNTSNPISYRGYYYDTETGLYYLKARYYDPTTGQFTQEDTVQDDNLQYNLYGYCSGNPILYVDPSGRVKIIVPYKNTLQEYNNFKKITKRAIDAAAKKYLLGKKYDLAYDMFHHALYGNGKTLGNSVLNKLKKKIKNSKEFKSFLDRYIKPLKKKGVYGIRSMSCTLEFKQKKDPDLYYSIQKATCVYKGSYNKGIWKLYINVFDTYDFNNIRTFEFGVSVGNVANDMGFVLQKLNYVTKYFVGIDFNYNYKS